ncbi:MAG: cytochrome c oxidase accessory protein CcoG [Pseudomonadota bacterium]
MTDDPTKRNPEPALDQEVEQSLYKKREKIYPREVHGVFARLRTLAMVALLGLYYGIPWLQWDDRQLVLFDLPARKFYIFGWTFWPQDFFYLSLLLIIAALSLFFFTAMAGRLWCGYACPQTVWTEIFLWFERKIEGTSKQQKALAQQPMSGAKFARRSAKQAVWILFSLWTGFTFVGYFTPILDLAQSVASLSLGPWETFWVLFYSFATYGNAGFMREQVCIYMCPYARFQSAMFDNDTLIISYDEARGNPKGPRKRSVDRKASGLGDCIDCNLCVQVCPTGIDIRDGLQYQCIGCAACIDVCDEVMDKMGYPKGLIKYTTENALSGNPAHLARPRVLIYGGLILFLFVALIYAVNARIPVELNIVRDRNALYHETDEGLIENVYTLKIVNMENAPQTFRLEASGIPGLQLENQMGDVLVASGAVQEVPVRLRASPSNLKTGSTTVEFSIRSLDNPDLHTADNGRFLGPARR